MDKFFIPLQTQGYCLRSWVDNDIESLAQYANDRAIWLNMRDEFPYPYSIKDAAVFIANINHNPNTIHLAIANQHEAVGSVSLLIHDDIRRYSGVLSYWIGKKILGTRTSNRCH